MASAVTTVSKLIPLRRPSRTFEADEFLVRTKELRPIHKESHTPGSSEWFDHAERLEKLLAEEKKAAEAAAAMSQAMAIAGP